MDRAYLNALLFRCFMSIL